MSHSKYAIVNIAGQQFKVLEGSKVKVNLLPHEVGTSLHFSDVCLFKSDDHLKIGTPLVDGAQVTAQVVSHSRDDKVVVFKYLRKNKSKKMQGHRQPYTYLAIQKIEATL